MTIQYRLTQPGLDISQVVEPCVRSTWIEKTASSIPLKDWFRIRGTDSSVAPVSVKRCPAIRDYFNHCLMVKFPVDTLLEVSSDGRYRWDLPAGVLGWDVQSHPISQWDNEHNPYKDKVNIKFRLPILMSSKKAKLVAPVDPFYHNRQPYTVMPGIVDVNLLSKFGNQATFAVNTFFDRKNEQYLFKAGEVMCYLMVLDGDTRLKENNKIGVDTPPKNVFLGFYNAQRKLRDKNV